MTKKVTKKQNEKEKIAIKEADLWNIISSSVKPISSESKNRNSVDDLPGLVNKSEQILQKKTPITKTSDKKSLTLQKTNVKTNIPQLTGIDRRLKQKLLRGNVTIEGRIDLHGASQIEAQQLLKNFFVASQQRGASLVLVITGKGASPYTRHILHSQENYQTPEREGVLRQNFPEWMKGSEFSHYVSGFQPAHPKHGGGGAFYVKLKKLKK